jgi:hypothetical protein
MHPAITKRAADLREAGFDPGEFYGDYFLELPGRIEAPTQYGTFVVFTDLYPQVDSAWFIPDAESAWRFRPTPA